MNNFDSAYLGLVRKIRDEGYDGGDRTGTGTRKLFGEQLKFDLREGFPLLTTKKMFYKGIIHELLWIISGSTNIHYLLEHNVRIWDQWTPAWKAGGKARVDECFAQALSTGLEHPDLSIGPAYGHQWRNFGACEVETGDMGITHAVREGFDQLADVIQRIKDKPTDRRLIVSAWNPHDVPNQQLPPCHCFYQFNVFGDRLDLMMTQRSCDVFLGVPFNIASYALLLAMVAQVTGLKPGIFTHSYGDVHIYQNHFEAVEEQLSRERDAFLPPKLWLNPEVKSIDDFVMSDLREDIKIVDYLSHDAIKAEVSV